MSRLLKVNKPIIKQMEKNIASKITPKSIQIYTDGSCLGNPGRGGWAYYSIEEKHEIYGQSFVENTTNNKMELMAVIKALEYLNITPANVQIFTDSMYVKNGIETWIKNWKSNGWKSASKQPVKNSDLWMTLDSLVENRKKYGSLEFIHVKAHSGDMYNEIVDKLARTGEL